MSTELLTAIEHICSRMTERRIALFLGAGINFGLVNEDGLRCPLGQDLADLIGRDLLGMNSGGGRPLDTVAEMARYRAGTSEVNAYLHKLFKSFAPGTQQLSLVQLPWNVIYTTNYDTLVEDAAANHAITPAGVIRRVVSVKEATDNFSEDDIPYFKLHGCIDVANTDHGRLILTKEDYRFYEQHRKPLFRRLREDLIHQTLLFIGYGLEDDNFRAILEDCRSELNTQTFPQSYAIRVGATTEEQTFWREKYNITTLNIDGQEFLSQLRVTWNTQKCSVVPFELRHTNEYARFDDNTSFQKVGESFYLVKVTDCASAANPKEFFKGREPGWGDIREQVPPARDAYYALLDAMLEEIVETSVKGNVYLVTGAAGNGKTTLVRMLAFELASSAVPTVIHIPGTPLDDRVLGPLFSSEQPKRVVVIVEHAAERIHEVERFIGDVRQKKLPVTLVVAERKNLWEYATNRGRLSDSFAEFELGRLSNDEIDRVLGALERHDALGKLTGTSSDYQFEHFDQLADKELLVALRELTESGSFDEIIRDEYEKIPSEVAKDAYRFVAAMGQVDQPIRLEVLARVLEIGVEQIGSQVIRATEGILLTGEDFGNSRHNAGFRVRARHPVIASVIFEFSAPDDQAKYDVINSLISHLNASFPEDRRVLTNIVRRKELVNTIASQRLRRSIYDRLETVLPDDPYVLQHRSLLERDMEDADAAIHYAKAAIQMQPRNPAFKNTLGYAYEAKARTAEPLERDGLLRKATSIFNDGIKADATQPFGYLGLFQVMKQKERNETAQNARMKMRLDMLSLLEEAYDATGNSHMISGPLASMKESLGEPQEAIDFLTDEVKRQPQDARLCDLLVRMLNTAGRTESALHSAEEGTKHNPTAWRLQRHIARLKRTLGQAVDSIIGHYEAAFRHNRGDAGLIAEYGAFLFMEGRHQDAEGVFSQGRKLPGPERRRVRESWKDNSGRDRVFVGHVHSITAAVGHVMAVPENFTALFWRTQERLASLRQRDKVTFTIGFSASGAITKSIRKAN